MLHYRIQRVTIGVVNRPIERGVHRDIARTCVMDGARQRLQAVVRS